MTRSQTVLALAAALAAGAVTDPAAADWPGIGGTDARDGRAVTGAPGPLAPELRWSGGDPSIIAWHPVIEDERVFVVRQTSFVPTGVPFDSPIFCYDLATGAELWRADLPYQDGDWTTWIAGARDGRVYASRAGNGASVSAPLVALDTADGSVLWESDDLVDAGAYDGVVFAPDGDLLVASFDDVRRIDAETGATVWTTARTCSVSGSCGGARFGDALYVVDAAPGGHVVVKLDVATGALLDEGPLMQGFTLQQQPLVAPDGTILVNRTQNNESTDFLYALEDDGVDITIRWRKPAKWVTNGVFAVAADGASVYAVTPLLELVRYDLATGAILDTAGILPDIGNPRMAVDAEGTLFVSNGGFANGRLRAFTADLRELWTEPITNVNIGGPALAEDGTMIAVGNGTIVRAYAGGGGAPACPGDVDGDGTVGFEDLLGLLAAWGPCGGKDCPADLDDDGDVDFEDLLALLADWGCPG